MVVIKYNLEKMKKENELLKEEIKKIKNSNSQFPIQISQDEIEIFSKISQVNPKVNYTYPLVMILD